MTITDCIFQSINNLLDDCMFYFDDEPMDILNEPDIIEIVAMKLKKINRRGYCNPTVEQLQTINDINWIDKAYEFIEEYVEEQGGQGPHM